MDTTLPHPQAELDAEGSYVFPRGVVQPEVPVFLDSGYEVSGAPGAVVHAHGLGTPFAIGWPRGLVPDDHWTPEGWRSRGVAYLTARGSNWDGGVHYTPAPRWANGKVFRAEFAGRKHVPSWNGVPLAGCQSDELGYADSPDPWHLVCYDGRAWLHLRTADGVVRKWSVQIDPSADLLDVAVAVDLTTGAATATLGGTPAAVDASQAGTGFGAATRLRDNTHAPFCVLHLVPHQHGRGFKWAEQATIPDVTVARVALALDGVPLAEFVGTDPRPQTYPGGPSLPLARCRGDTTFLWAVHTSQWEPQGARDVVLRDLRVSVRPANPAVQVGGVFGGSGARLERLRIDNGSRGVQTHGFMLYPLTIRDCHFIYQSEYGLWLYRGCGMTLECNQIDYPRRAPVHLRDCWGEVRGSVLYAPAYAGETCVAEQYGGQVNYQGHTADYEYGDRPPFLSLVPWSNEGFDTTARLTSCTTLGGLAADVRPRVKGYAGAVRVEVRADNPGDDRVRVAAGVYPTLVGCVRED